MTFSRSLRRSARLTRPFRPAVLPLEDRTVPSVSHLTAGAATHLQLILPESAQSGKTFTAEVIALDGSGHVASNFTDTVQLTTNDTAATGFPVTVKFNSTGKAIGFAQVQLTTVGPEKITAADTTNTSVTGDTESTNVTAAPVASKVVVETPKTAATGVLTPVEVEVLDQSGRVLRNFTGTVTLTSGDAAATASATKSGTQTSIATTANPQFTYTFTSSDHGEHTFWVTFGTGTAAGTATTVTATTPGPNSTTLSGSGGVTVYPPAVVTHFDVDVKPSFFGLGLAVAGQAAAMQVEALNASNQVVSNYNGTVSFSLGTADSGATISATKGGTASSLSGFTYQFTTGTGADNGKHTFYLTLTVTGSQTVKVSDNSTPPVTGSESVFVVNLPHHGGWWL